MNGSFVTICLAGTMLAFLAGQLQTEELNLDKTGATRCENWLPIQQTPEKQEPAKAGSSDTEREGFEATNHQVGAI